MSRQYIAVLSGLNPRLARTELESILKKWGQKSESLYEDERLVYFETEKSIRFPPLGLIHEVAEYVCDAREAHTIPWEKIVKGSVEVRARPVGRATDTVDSVALEQKVGAAIHARGVPISLSSPDTRVRVYPLPNGRVLVGVIVAEADKKGFRERNPVNRPFFRPVSLDPRVARSMVNLARVGKGDRVLDPFCGTGGILIEAGLLGARVFGIDNNPEMVEGTKKNLEHYGIKTYYVREGDAFDAREIFGESFDAIVTDLPYGRNTPQTIKEAERLARNFLPYAKSLLKPGGVLVMATRIELEEPGYFTLEARVPHYVHKSMTKHIHVFS